MNVSEIGERALIERIRGRVGTGRSGSLVVGVGDDAAVAVPDRGALQVLTVDALVEGVHFDRRFSTPADIGYKALAVNISDIAAMGGTPRLALLSLLLPDALAVGDVDGLLDGLLDLARTADVALAGGNISRSPGPLVVDVTVTGAVKPRKVLTRAGGRPGHALYVSGMVGAAAAGLGWLRAHAGRPDDVPPDPELAGCVRRHRRPEPRSRLGALLGRNKAASACIDLSDGLADGVRRIAEASGTGARLDASQLPIHPGAARWFGSADLDACEMALGSGDDYELLFAVPPRARGRLRGIGRQIRGLRLTWIGELTAERTLSLVRDGQPTDLPQGFAHF